MVKVLTGWAGTAGIFRMVIWLIFNLRSSTGSLFTMMQTVATMLSSFSSCRSAQGDDDVDQENDSDENQDDRHDDDCRLHRI